MILLKLTSIMAFLCLELSNGPQLIQDKIRSLRWPTGHYMICPHLTSFPSSYSPCFLPSATPPSCSLPMHQAQAHLPGTLFLQVFTRLTPLPPSGLCSSCTLFWFAASTPRHPHIPQSLLSCHLSPHLYGIISSPMLPAVCLPLLECRLQKDRDFCLCLVFISGQRQWQAYGITDHFPYHQAWFSLDIPSFC